MSKIWTLFALFSTFVLLHVFAMEYHLYWHIKWFDVPMHVMGGALIGYGFYAARENTTWFSFIKKNKKRCDAVAAILFVLLFGIAWEIFEPEINYVFAPHLIRYLAAHSTVMDNLHDVVCDLIGGIAIIGMRMRGKRVSQPTHD